MGYLFGVMIPSLINRIKLGYWGLYPVLLISLIAILFGLTENIGGNGFIAVYTAEFLQIKRSFYIRKI